MHAYNEYTVFISAMLYTSVGQVFCDYKQGSSLHIMIKQPIWRPSAYIVINPNPIMHVCISIIICRTQSEEMLSVLNVISGVVSQDRSE